MKQPSNLSQILSGDHILWSDEEKTRGRRFDVFFMGNGRDYFVNPRPELTVEQMFTTNNKGERICRKVDDVIGDYRVMSSIPQLKREDIENEWFTNADDWEYQSALFASLTGWY